MTEHGVRRYTDLELKHAFYQCVHMGLDATAKMVQREMCRRALIDRDTTELLLLLPLAVAPLG